MVLDEQKQPVFDANSLMKTNEYKNETKKKRTQTGEGTVPYLAAKPPFLSDAQLVCLSPEDYGAWEFSNRMLTWATDLHGMFMTMNVLQRIVVAFLTGVRSHDNVWGRTAPDLSGRSKWQPPLELSQQD
ncbi:MAG: hypothetical protein AAF627_22355 [Myxococcota bacterium]